MRAYYSVFLLLSIAAHAELRYFTRGAEEDFVGVKNARGDVIIPATHRNLYGIADGSPVTTPTIELFPANIPALPAQAVARPAGIVYNLEGKALYTPLWFDNGMDGWAEGLRRYVANGKVGFADRAGHTVIPAQWTYADAFNFGYAQVYDGNWQKQFIDFNEDYWRIVPTDGSAETYLINTRGERVEPLPDGDARAYRHDGKTYPYPFRYSPREQAVRDYFNRQALLADLLVFNHAERPAVQFEITERQGDTLILQAFADQLGRDGQRFAVAGDGTLSVILWDEQRRPLRDWAAETLAQAQTWFAEHPDAPQHFSPPAQQDALHALCATLAWDADNGLVCIP